MKKHLSNDACVPLIRAREEFENRRASLKGHGHTPGFGYSWGHLPAKYHTRVIEASFIVYSYDTPIAWHGPAPALTLADIERFLDGPGLVELEQMLTSEGASPRTPAFPAGEDCWQVPAVRYSRTTTQHQGVLWQALAYERTWREAEDRTSVPAPYWSQTEFAVTTYDKFDKVPSSTGGVNW